ncbi:MAG: hypothetical protein H6610_09975 [Ignavibacteriales bacterium]|nr:hypothetical protein [Ignavibacteriales bacterium]MCB9219770.1 hypothetical protein [Ignavibacteriales bacterium]MCB9260031.1 hypothetical protein [Ignavibacteriales bacterium]
MITSNRQMIGDINLLPLSVLLLNIVLLQAISARNGTVTSCNRVILSQRVVNACWWI